MKLKLLLSVALTLAFASTAVRAEEITLTNGEWLPYTSEHLPHHGVISRIVSEAFAAEGVTVNFRFRPWPRAFAEAQRGLAHGSVVWGTGEAWSRRTKEFLFSEPVFEDESVFFYRKGIDFKWTRYSDLARYKLGGVAGYEYRFQNIPGLRIDRAPSDELTFRKLVAGRVDVFPSSLNVGKYILRTKFTPQESAEIEIYKGSFNVTKYYLILARSRPGSAALIEKFNRGLRQLQENGTYAQYMDELQAGKY
jgi:polar amino acid transport system substrate-binding protein